MLASDDLGLESQALASDSVAQASVTDADKIRYKVNDLIWLGAIKRATALAQ